MDRAGGLSLRADVANYSRAVKTGTWHLAREQEPKDYDMSKGERRNLCRSTYNRMATVTDGTFPMTTYDEMTLSSLRLKDDFATRPGAPPMVSLKNMSNENQVLERSIEAMGIKVNENSSVLPRPDPLRNKMHLQSTHQSDFQWRLPMVDTKSSKTQYCLQSDLTTAYKRCHSQFTDWDIYKRPGRNTWKDESGVYANSHLRAQLPSYQITETVPSWS